MADTVKDPVCGMEFGPKSAAAAEVRDGQIFCFCSEVCHRTFVDSPGDYRHAKEEPAHAGHAGR